MTFIRNFTSRFSNKTISVEIDPDLLTELDTIDQITTSRNITFNLYKLIYHIGTIQSRRFAPSNRLKFSDKSDLIETIYRNTNEFRVRVNDIRTANGSETLTSISEDFGIGISVVIAEKLFKIKRSTIQRIYGTGRRPDWKCQTTDNRILVVECKGSTSMQTSIQQEVNALDQKTKEAGDIQIASLTVINEATISTNRFLDPPIEQSNISPIMENHILRAGHYASVFSFLGNSRLSRYYSQMRKRLEGKITPYEQTEKNKIFKEIRTNDPIVRFKEREFTGSFYEIENKKFLFVGVDKELLSYTGFLEFKDYESDSDTLINGNYYNLFKDGVLIIEIVEIQEFNNIIDINRIKNYQNKITISDIDEMNEISFSKYFIHLLKRNDFNIIEEQAMVSSFQFDLVANYNDETYFFEFKLFKSKRIDIKTIDRLNFYNRQVTNGKIVLVTNGKINYESIDTARITVIDRLELKKIANNYTNLIKLITS
ncbi:hypothetical protein [Kordia sp.]|uniref:hypothetical protein n=1 Tax=Kordia sp. TaxID=1965332 RepID=UPI003D29DD0A